MKKSKSEYLVVIVIFFSFFLGWLLSSGATVFFNEKKVMDQQPTVPSMQPIGFDLQMIVKGSREFIEGRTPYAVNSYSYPPFTVLSFMPFIFMPHADVYIVITLLTLIGFIVSMVLIDKTIQSKVSIPPLLLFFLVTAFFSYGFQFELEREQFNIIAITFAILGMFLFIRDKRILGLLLFSIAMQLKIYPAIFLILFFFIGIKNKKNIILFLVLATGNLLLLFILGGHVFQEFISALVTQIKTPYFWIGNHSLAAYCSGEIVSSFCSKQAYAFFLGGYLLILLSTIFIGWKKALGGFNGYLFTLCGLGLLVLPSASHDYTLSLLPVILYPFCKELYIQLTDKKRFLPLFFLGITIFFYTLILFSSLYIPTLTLLPANKAPLLLMLIGIVFIALIMSTYPIRRR